MRKEEKILTRLVMGALLAGSVGVWMPQTAMAAENDAIQSTETALTVTSEAVNESGTAISATDTVFGNVGIEKSGVPVNVVSSTNLATITSSSLSASDYTVTINSGTMESVYGGFTTGDEATGNTVIINGGTINSATSDAIIGGKATTTASNNTINITGGIVAGSIIGGDAATASNNTINITGGTIGAAGKWTSINAGRSTVNGGTVSGNTITISGDVNFLGNVLISTGTTQDAGTSSNNTLNILTKIAVAELSGGDGATHSGNTLNIAAKDITTNAVMSFDAINFYLPSNIANGDTMLTIKYSSEFGNTADLTGVTFGVTALSGVSLTKGDTVNLILGDGVTLNTDSTLTTADSSSLGSASFLSLKNLDTVNTYTLSISKSGDNAIIATVDNVTGSSTDDSSNSNSGSGDSGNSSSGGSSSSSSSSSSDVKKNTVETRAAAVSMLTQGSDFLASTGFSEAANAVSQATAEAQASGVEAPAAVSFTPFAAVGGQKMRAESGSHVDIKGFGLNVGFAREVANKNGKLLFGPVVEYGRGSYDSYNNDVHGDGNSSYWGLGLMARQTNHDGLYYEGSVRGGRSKSDYASSVTVAGVPVNISYDSSSTYWSAHLGIGKIVSLSKNNTLDGYLKYFYTHQGGDTVTIVGAPMAFDAVNSHRLRLGGRLTHKLNERDSIYGGLAYQYEFGGEARATYNGTATPAPSVKGGSGMLELGYNVKASDKVTLDFGVTGWAGKQRGITGQIGAQWKF